MKSYQPSERSLASQHLARAHQGLHSVVLPKEAVLDLLNQPGAQDLRLHLGQDEHGSTTVFATATQTDGSNITALVVQAITPCPPLCGPGTTGLD